MSRPPAIMGRPAEQEGSEPAEPSYPRAPTAGERLRGYARPDGRKDRDAGAGARKPARDSRSEPKTRLAIALGTEHGLRPADVVGSIANEAGVPGREIGPIEIGETSTIVSVPARVASMVIQKLASARLRGKSFRIRREGEPLGRRDDDRSEVPAQRSKQAEETPEPNSGPEAGDRPEATGQRPEQAPAAPRPYKQAAAPADRAEAKPVGHKPFYSRFKDGGAQPGSDEREKRPFRATREPYAKPAGDKPYRSAPRSYGKPGGDKPYRSAPGAYAKPGTDKPYRSTRDASAKPAGDKPHRSAPGTYAKPGGDRPYRSTRDASTKPASDKPYRSAPGAYAKPGGDKPYRSTRDASAKPAGDKPYRARPSEGARSARKDVRGKKPFSAAPKGGYDKPGGKKPFYKTVVDKKFKKKPK